MDDTAACHPTPLLRGLPPVVNAETRLMVLGSFPSVASLAHGQYYAHPRNQFWRLLSALWGLHGARAMEALPYAQRLDTLRAHGLGLWDVYAQCERQGSLDSAIQRAQLNALHRLNEWAPGLRAIAHHGGESARHARITQALGWPLIRLPSTSPANASWSFERKVDAWRTAFEAHGLLSPPPA